MPVAASSRILGSTMYRVESGRDGAESAVNRAERKCAKLRERSGRAGERCAKWRKRCGRAGERCAKWRVRRAKWRLTQYYLTYVCGALLRLRVDDTSPRSVTTWRRAHKRCAGSVYAAMVQLEGLWVKVGQYLSTRADVMPPPYLHLLRLLQDTLPPRDMSEVLATIEEQLGSPPSEAFSSFDHQPLATASIAQVHRAVLASGQQVVVKVQHAGIKEKILQ
ncbi:unnamed protein product, partial [Closterium sp. NIES-53]